MRSSRLRPSPSLVISTIALFVSLGGSAWAVATIGSEDIRKGAVTTRKLHAGAVTAAKLRAGAVQTRHLAPRAVGGEQLADAAVGTRQLADGAVTSAKLDPATLSALRHPESAAFAQRAGEATTFSRYGTSGLVKAAVGETVPLGGVGPFSIAGHCIDEGGAARRARIVIATSQADSELSAYNVNYTSANFEPGVAAEIGNDIADDEPEWRGRFDQNEWTAASGDGTTLLEGVANNGVYVFGAECAFNVSWTNGG
ncbi:MAG TPA: hypothetical protein VHA54_03665 [Solirubrobacterales bacterium]|nr:hypothetical protein [Solirubrobacterales bacterium]